MHIEHACRCNGALAQRVRTYMLHMIDDTLPTSKKHEVINTQIMTYSEL